MTDAEKKDILSKMYLIEKKSLGQIGDILNIYPNKLRRDAKKFGITLRDKSQAQKNALNEGTHKHPTKGQKRTPQTKQKIGKSVMKSWSSLSEEELEERRNNAKSQWDNLDENKRLEIIQLANKAVRKSSKEGSKLEKALLQCLLTDGHAVDFHKEQILSNSKLQLDLFLPKLNIAIEVDGPSHFDSIWGDVALAKNTKYDHKKEGLLAGKGIKLIRIKQEKDYSDTRTNILYEQIKLLLKTHNSLSVITRLEY